MPYLKTNNLVIKRRLFQLFIRPHFQNVLNYLVCIKPSLVLDQKSLFRGKLRKWARFFLRIGYSVRDEACLAILGGTHPNTWIEEARNMTEKIFRKLHNSRSKGFLIMEPDTREIWQHLSEI